MELLHNTLYALSNALLIPTLATVVGLSAWVAVALGGVGREWLGRREVRETLRSLRRIAKEGPEGRHAALLTLRACRNGLPARLGRQLSEWPNSRELAKALEDLELDVAASVSKLAWVTRIAPMLGLMGTLIPLGPALTGLASGNIATLSSNLVVAFTTTVVGVFIGSASFTIGLVRRSWYNRDMSDLEHALESLSGSSDLYEKETAQVG